MLLFALFLGGILPVSPIQLLLGTEIIGMQIGSIVGNKWEALWMQGDAWSEVSISTTREVLVRGSQWLDNYWVVF